MSATLIVEVLRRPGMLADQNLMEHALEQFRRDPQALRALLDQHRQFGLLQARLEELEQEEEQREASAPRTRVPVIDLQSDAEDPSSSWAIVGGIQGFQQIPLNGHRQPRRGHTVVLAPEGQGIEAVLPELWPGATEVGQVEARGPEWVVVADEASAERHLWLADDLRELDPPLQVGDRVRYDSRCALAVARVEGREPAAEWVAEKVTSTTFADLAGIDPTVERLREVLHLLAASEKERQRWNLHGASVLLLHGPPGTGKTASARALAGEVARRFGKEALFLALKAGQLEHWLYGRSEFLVRSLFSFIKRQVAEGHYVVIFLDEVEVLLRTRAESWNYAGHGTLGAFLSELQPEQLPEHCCFIMATNRVDLVDPAARRRAEQVAVGRPDARGAAAIFVLKLEQLHRDCLAQPAKQLATDMAAYAYSDHPVTTLRFHDRSERTLTYADFMTGALIEKTVGIAARRNFLRSQQPLTVADLIQTLDEEMSALGETLTAENAPVYVDGLGSYPRVVAVQRAASGPQVSAARFIAEDAEEEDDE